MKDFDQIEAEVKRAGVDAQQAERQAKSDLRRKVLEDRIERMEFHIEALAGNIKSIKSMVKFFLVVFLVSVCVSVFLDIYHYARLT